MAYKYKYAPKLQRSSSTPMMGDYLARRAMYGGSGGAGRSEFGHGLGALGAGIGSYLASIGQNKSANTEMQQYNTVNPPRGSLVGVPGESVDQWAAQHPNVPTEQSTVPAPYGQGTVGMQNWMEMQREMQAEDAAKQQSVMRGLQAANLQQEMQLRGMRLPGGPEYAGPGGPRYRPLNTGMNSADRKTMAGIADVHSMIQQRLGQDVDAQTLGQFAGNWTQDPNNPGAMYNPELAKHLNIDPAKTSVDANNLKAWGPMIQQEILLQRQHPDYFQGGGQGAAPRAQPAKEGNQPQTGGGFVSSVIGGRPEEGQTAQPQESPSPVQQQMQTAGTSGPVHPAVSPQVYSGGPNAASVRNAQSAASPQVYPATSNMQSDYFKQQMRPPPADWWEMMGVTPGT